MKTLNTFLAAIVCLVLLGTSARGQASLTGIGTPYTQNFDGMGTTSISPWSDNVSLTGWYVWRTTGTNPANVTAGDGSSNTGGLYNFGIASDGDRALGAMGSGGTSTIYYGVRLRNNTGQTITSLSISYYGEQWRYGGTAATQSMTVSYQAGATVTSLTTGSWTDIAALEFISPITSGTTGGLNGNDPANRIQLSTTLGVTISPNSEIMLRWVEIDHSGGDHGLATDILSITPQLPVITQFYSKASGNLDVLSTWGPDSTNGSGTAPLSFTAANQAFNARNSATKTIGAAWTVSGSLSKVVVGDGTNACNFTVPSGFAFNGTVDVSANATLTLQNAALPALGSLATTSTVNYAQSGSVVVPGATYGNLTLTGGTKTFEAGATTVQGNLLVVGVADFAGAGSPFSTVSLAGNFTLQSATAFSNADSSRFTLNCNGTNVQTLNGNGSEFKLFRLNAGNAAGVVLASGSSNLTLGNPSGGGLQIDAGTLATNNNTVQTFAGKTFITMPGGTVTPSASSNFIFNQSNAATSGFGTLRLTPGSETINNLTVNLSDTTRYGWLKLGNNVTVAGTLTLVNGTVRTDSNTLVANGSVVRTNGRVWGKMQKPIPTGATTRTFEIGDTLAYTPVSVAFGNVTGAGNLAAITTPGVHPDLATSGLDVTKKLNRYYTITNGGTAFNNCTVTFNYVAGDVDGGANTANFGVRKYAGGWTSPTSASPLPTSIQATGLTSFSDFAIGEVSGGGSQETTFPVNNAWNIVSVPRVPTDFTASTLFSGAIPGTINSFLTGGYTQPTTLQNGEGYWAFYGSAGSNTISGTTLTSGSVTVATGNRWVLVGSVTAPVPASALTSNPPGAIVVGTLFGWSGTAYSAPTTLDPGKGYWVFVNAPCDLTVSSASVRPAKANVGATSDLNRTVNLNMK